MRELSVVEQRYRAVLEVRAGVTVTEVAQRYGVSRQSVHAWLRRYAAEGVAALEDRSHRPRGHPATLEGEVEALICELRRAHRRWGPRRLQFELARRGHRVARSTIYRVLVRNGLIEARRRRRRRDEYVRWERDAPMELWQLDVTASLFLVDGRQPRIVTGLDDHSRFSVLAKVVPRATARAVCRALVEAMASYGVPEEVLTDNAKVFTGRFTRPAAVEVLFERICRENGVTARLTKPHSPTTTGKIERFHETLQDELLDEHGPFASLEAAQAAIDAWRADYNHNRPHQSLDMGTPASRFRPAPSDRLALRVPPELAAPPAASPDEEGDGGGESGESDESGELGPYERVWQPPQAVELKRVVPPSGNLCVAGQQIWLGPSLGGRVVTIWVDQTRLHVSLDAVRLKTLPSRLSAPDLVRLGAADGQPAGPPPLPEGDEQAGVDVERTVNASGLISLAGRYHSVGQHLAGQRVTLRLHGTTMAVLAGPKLLRSVPCPLSVADRAALRGARPSPRQAVVVTDPIIVQRRVSARGSIRAVNQNVQIGKTHAGKTVTVRVEADRFHIAVDDHLAIEVARTNRQPVRRFKVHATARTPKTPYRKA